MCQVDKERQILFARIAQHEMPYRIGSSIDRLEGSDLSVLVRNNCLLINSDANRLHQEPCQDKCQSDQGLIRRSGLSSQSLPQEVEDHQQSYKRRHAQKQRRNQCQQREEENDAPRQRALGAQSRPGERVFVSRRRKRGSACDEDQSGKQPAAQPSDNHGHCVRSRSNRDLPISRLADVWAPISVSNRMDCAVLPIRKRR